MNSTFQQPSSTAINSIGRALVSTFYEIAPAVLFFFTAFLIIGMMFKLFVSQYSIEFSAFTRAAIAALVLGKIVALLDWAKAGHRLDGQRRAAVVALKTLIYGLVVVVFGIGERIFDASYKTGSLQRGVDLVIAKANFNRFLGLVLLITLVVGARLTLQEISQAMGEGAMFRLFFEQPVQRPKGLKDA